jgi:hypothetical protein
MTKFAAIAAFGLFCCPTPVFAQAEGMAPDTVSRAIEGCENRLRSQLGKEGWSQIALQSAKVDDTPNRNDWIIGWLQGQQGGKQRDMDFSCHVDLHDGHVLSADVKPRSAKP